MTDMTNGVTGGMTMVSLIAICAVLICGMCAVGRCGVKTGENGKLVVHAGGDAGSTATKS